MKQSGTAAIAAVPLCRLTAFDAGHIIFRIIFYILFCIISFGSLREPDSPSAGIGKWTFAGYCVRSLTSTPFPTKIKKYNHRN